MLNLESHERKRYSVAVIGCFYKVAQFCVAGSWVSCRVIGHGNINVGRISFEQ